SKQGYPHSLCVVLHRFSSLSKHPARKSVQPSSTAPDTSPIYYRSTLLMAERPILVDFSRSPQGRVPLDICPPYQKPACPAHVLYMLPQYPVFLQMGAPHISFRVRSYQIPREVRFGPAEYF